MQLPTYQCRIAWQIVQIRAAISDLASCFPTVSEIQSIANEAIPCVLTIEVLFDIYQREVNAALCYLQSEIGGTTIDVLGQDFIFDLLSYNDNLFIYNAFAGSFTFSNLTIVNQNLFFSFDDTLGGNMSFLRFVSLPVLGSIVGKFFLVRCPNLTSISAPALTDIGTDLNISSNASLTDVDFSGLVNLGGNFEASGSLINGLSLPNLASWGGTEWKCDSNSIPTADVNALLIKLASFLPYTGRDINFSGGGNGPPTGAGITAKNAIIAATNTVETN